MNTYGFHTRESFFGEILAYLSFYFQLWKISNTEINRSPIYSRPSLTDHEPIANHVPQCLPIFPPEYYLQPTWIMRFPVGTSSKEPVYQSRRHRSCGFDPWVRKIPPTPIFLPGEPHGQRELVGYSPWVHKESDTAQQLSMTTITPDSSLWLISSYQHELPNVGLGRAN